ncbi:MAG TPA: TatD family hydrolase [Gammaproteobacteria bacterium]
MTQLLVDSHCHIPMIDAEINDLLGRASELGVGHMLCVAVDLDTYPDVLQLAKTHAYIFASVGVHPNQQVEREPGIDELVELASDPDVVAIGETGLDYYRSSGDLAWQRDRFRTHIKAAREINKPIIIHSRDARDDMIKIMREEGADQVAGVMHCFVDDWQTARAAMDLGFYISFSGIVTFKNAKEVQDVAQKIPLERLLVETDSPYLTPTPYRGKMNQPGYVHYVAKFLSELRGESFEKLAEATTNNFFTLFKDAEKVN